MRRHGPLVARVLWALLFLVHMIPAVAVANRLLNTCTAKGVFSLAAIAAIMALAALKTINVPWLRVPLCRRSWCGLLLVALIIHGDFVAHRLPDCIVLEAATPILLGLVCLQHRLVKALQKFIAQLLATFSETFWHWLEEVIVVLENWPPTALALPRGPPLR
jgi:hypothetical protein